MTTGDLQDALERALAGGPERHRDKAREQGKLPVRERVARLVDDGSFAEEALLANWEGEGLCAFSAVDRTPGPGWIGVGILLATTVAAAGGKATLIGWPLVLAVGAGGLLATGLRPSRPLPPAPSRGEAHVFEIRSEQ